MVRFKTRQQYSTALLLAMLVILVSCSKGEGLPPDDDDGGGELTAKLNCVHQHQTAAFRGCAVEVLSNFELDQKERDELLSEFPAECPNESVDSSGSESKRAARASLIGCLSRD